MKHINCPTCGFPNPINLVTCEFCDAALKDALLENPELIPCATCSGTGLIHLEYADSNDDDPDDPEDQWLPCASCGGTGRISLPDIRAAEMNKGCFGVIDLAVGLFEIFFGK